MITSEKQTHPYHYADQTVVHLFIPFVLVAKQSETEKEVGGDPGDYAEQNQNNQTYNCKWRHIVLFKC